MAIDVRRVLEAALEAAIQDPTPPTKPKKRRLSTGRALLLGAGVVTAGRVVAGSKGREMVGHLRQRIADSDWYREMGLADGADDEDELDAQGDEDLEAPEGDDEELDQDEELGEDEELEPAAEADEDPGESVDEPDPPRARRRRTRGRG